MSDCESCNENAEHPDEAERKLAASAKTGRNNTTMSDPVKFVSHTVGKTVKHSGLVTPRGMVYHTPGFGGHGEMCATAGVKHEYGDLIDHHGWVRVSGHAKKMDIAASRHAKDDARQAALDIAHTAEGTGGHVQWDCGGHGKDGDWGQGASDLENHYNKLHKGHGSSACVCGGSREEHTCGPGSAMPECGHKPGQHECMHGPQLPGKDGCLCGEYRPGVMKSIGKYQGLPHADQPVGKETGLAIDFHCSNCGKPSDTGLQCQHTAKMVCPKKACQKTLHHSVWKWAWDGTRLRHSLDGTTTLRKATDPFRPTQKFTAYDSKGRRYTHMKYHSSTSIKRDRADRPAKTLARFDVGRINHISVHHEGEGGHHALIPTDQWLMRRERDGKNVQTREGLFMEPTESTVKRYRKLAGNIKHQHNTDESHARRAAADIGTAIDDIKNPVRKSQAVFKGMFSGTSNNNTPRCADCNHHESVHQKLGDGSPYCMGCSALDQMSGQHHEFRHPESAKRGCVCDPKKGIYNHGPNGCEGPGSNDHFPDTPKTLPKPVWVRTTGHAPKAARGVRTSNMFALRDKYHGSGTQAMDKALWKLKEGPRTKNADGSESYTIGPDLEEERCHKCGAEAFSQRCKPCDKTHHHGRVHKTSYGGELVAKCNECAAGKKPLRARPRADDPTDALTALRARYRGTGSKPLDKSVRNEEGR